MSVDRAVLARFDPATGEVSGSTAVHEPVVDHPVYGRSQLCSPTILRIHVADVDRWVSDVGRTAKRRPCSRTRSRSRSTWSPASELPPTASPGSTRTPNRSGSTCSSATTRSTARSRSGIDRSPTRIDALVGTTTPFVEDIVRLGEADWNWFSNWMYGVPAPVLRLHDRIEMNPCHPARDRSRSESARRTGITCGCRGSMWRAATSATIQGRSVSFHNTVTQNMWHPHKFSVMPHPRPNYPESFIPTLGRRRPRPSRTEEDDAAYHTLMFGGTTDTGKNPQFLDFRSRRPAR